MRELGSRIEFKQICNNNKVNAFLFYSSNSDKSKEALESIKQIDKDAKDILFYSINAAEVKDIHPEFNIDMVPTLLIMEGDKVKNIVYGLQSKDAYLKIIYDSGTMRVKNNEKEKRNNIVVYTSDGCPWCQKAKNYLKEKGFYFREINVSRKPSEAEKLVKRTGQMGTPQININGNFIIGFDKPKIDMLLGIK